MGNSEKLVGKSKTKDLELMEKSLTISNWLRSGEYHTLIDSVYTKIIRNCESSRNESQTASVFETEISFLVRNQLGIELYFSKEENVDGIVHKFAGLTSRQSGHGRLDAVVNDIVIEYKHMTNYLFFDTETTGVPRNYKAPSSDTRNWPRLVQLAWILTEENGNRIHTGNKIVKPDGFVIPADAARVHGITTQRAIAEGIPLNEVINQFRADLDIAACIVCHNVEFDKKIVGAEMIRLGMRDEVGRKKSLCTMLASTNFCRIPGYYGYKYPKLQELYWKLFGEDFDDAHNAMNDIEATERCFWELKKRGIM